MRRTNRNSQVEAQTITCESVRGPGVLPHGRFLDPARIPSCRSSYPHPPSPTTIAAWPLIQLAQIHVKASWTSARGTSLSSIELLAGERDRAKDELQHADEDGTGAGMSAEAAKAQWKTSRAPHTLTLRISWRFCDLTETVGRVAGCSARSARGAVEVQPQLVLTLLRTADGGGSLVCAGTVCFKKTFALLTFEHSIP